MIVNKILIIALSIIIIMSSILIGGPLKSNIEIVNALISTVAVCYIMWKTIKEKKKFIANKIDIFVILFMISSCIPLMFKTYISLESTILSIFQNISIAAIYFLVKQEKIEAKRKNSLIEKVIIISSIIIFIIGIDNLTSNLFAKKLNSVGILYFINTEDRLIANLGYANSTAIIMAMSSFIIMGLSLTKNKDISTLLYGILNFCCIVGIGLTRSKATILCFGVFFLLYIILLKEKSKRIEVVLKLITSTIAALMYIVLFEKIRALEVYEGTWLMIPLCGIVSGLLWLVINKIKEHFIKINKKQIILTITTITIFIIGAFIYGLYQTEELVLFTNSKGNKEVVHYIYNIEGNTEYKMNFDIVAKTNVKYGYQIQIEEENMYDQRVAVHSERFENFEGNKEFSFTTNKDTKKIKIRFIRREKEDDTSLTIKKLTVNDKEIALNYKYLPTSLVTLIKNINPKNKGAWERGVFILDGIKLAKENFWFGAGGNAWEYIYGTVQNYDYYATQSHCFYTQVILEHGFIAGISIFGIIVCMIIYSIKYLKKQNDAQYVMILCAIGILILHSAMDFDMSFFYIKIIAFALIGILSSYSKYEKMEKCKVLQIGAEVIVLVFFIVSVYGNATLAIAKRATNNKREEKDFDMANKLAPYSFEIKRREIQYIEMEKNDINRKVEIYNEIMKQEKAYEKVSIYNDLSNYAIMQLQKEKVEEAEVILKQAIEILKQRENRFPIRLENYLGNFNMILSNVNNLKEWKTNNVVKVYIKESIKQANDIAEEAYKNITDYRVTRMSEEYYEERIEELKYYQDQLSKIEKEL